MDMPLSVSFSLSVSFNGARHLILIEGCGCGERWLLDQAVIAIGVCGISR
jgi:hypothetical protein